MNTQIPVVHKKSLDTDRQILLDADILRYQIGAVEMRHPFLEKEFIPAPSEHICELVDNIIESTKVACNTSNYTTFLSGKTNFRNEIAKQAVYKGNRDPTKSRPYHFKTVGDHIESSHPLIFVDGKEADDAMGSTQFENWHKHYFSGDFSIDKLDTIIASRDKDLRTIPGLHYSWACGENQPEKPLYYISPYQANHMFFYQMLIGDNTDNIIGCGIRQLTKWGYEKDGSGIILLDEEGNKIPKIIMRRKGIGAAGALGILKECKTVKDMYWAVLDEYAKMFKDDCEEIMLENARLLFIGQEPDKLFEWDWLDYAYDLTKDNEVTQ